MKVIATTTGHDGFVVRHEGDEFEMPEGAKGSWFKPAGGDPAPKAPRAPRSSGRAETIGELAREQADLA